MIDLPQSLKVRASCGLFTDLLSMFLDKVAVFSRLHLNSTYCQSIDRAEWLTLYITRLQNCRCALNPSEKVP